MQVEKWLEDMNLTREQVFWIGVGATMTGFKDMVTETKPTTSVSFVQPKHQVPEVRIERREVLTGEKNVYGGSDWVYVSKKTEKIYAVINGDRREFYFHWNIETRGKHKRAVNFYCVVKGKIKNGTWHAKDYFKDEDGKVYVRGIGKSIERPGGRKLTGSEVNQIAERLDKTVGTPEGEKTLCIFLDDKAEDIILSWLALWREI